MKFFKEGCTSPKQCAQSGGLLRARICRSFKEPRNRFLAWRAGRQAYLTHLPARLHWLAESIPGLLKRLQIRAQATQPAPIGSCESFLGLLKRLQIRALGWINMQTQELPTAPPSFLSANLEAKILLYQLLRSGAASGRPKFLEST